MKRRLWSLIAAGLLALALLPSCAPKGPSPSGEAFPPPSAAEPASTPTLTPALTPTPSVAEATPTPAEPTPTAAPLDFSQEPPLDEYSASIAVPDFLTEEQQDLYRRARFLYNHMFSGETTALDDIRADVDMGRDGPEVIEQDGLRYYPATGRYRNWADFDTVIHELFTDDFWQARNTLEGPPQRSIYKEIDGRLWMADLSRGSGYYYNRNFPDEFRLDAKAGGKICFTVIGHYSPVWPREGETYEERDARLEREYEYILEFPIRMVLTENGWRFDEFHSGLVDEDDPRGQLIELDKVSYVDRLLGFSMDFPESWRGKLEVEQNYDINQSGRSCIVFYHKPSREVFPGGVLFSIDCCPGVWTEEAPPIPAGWSALVLQTERYTFFFRTPSDVQWCEGNEELTRDYKALEADFEYVRSHITPIN